MKARRTRKTRSIDSKIEAAKRMLEKVEARRDKLASNLKSLLDKRDEMRKQEIWDPISKSRRTHEEILNFIKA